MHGQRPSNADSTAAELHPRRPIAGFAGGPGGGAIWLDGDQPLTACPQCHGPMPVRIWLSLAECPRCGSSIRLSGAQEQQALALLRRPAASEGTASVPPAPPDVAAVANLPAAPLDGPTDVGDAGKPATAEAEENSLPTSVFHSAKERTFAERKATKDGSVSAANCHGDAEPQAAWTMSFGAFLLCCLVSAVLHLSLILLLGVWLIETETRDKLVLSATISERTADDGVEHIEMPVEELPDELSVTEISTPRPAPSTDRELVAALTTVQEPSGDLLPKTELGKLPVGNLSPGQVLAGRDPAFRGQLLAQEGGTSASEAAVARALKWLQQHQSAEGSWSLNHFSSAGDCDGRCADPGVESDTAATALALLPFLGAGQTHLRGDFTHTVARGLRALMDLQRPDGDLRGRGGGRMYAHGQATIALCEAYALSQSDHLRDPAQRAIDFIVSAQHEAGGWRYQPKEPGDLSVVGWQMMALRSAQMAYLKVPEESFLKAARFLNSVQQNPGVGLYGYMPGGGPTPVMTAEGLLCRQYSGWRHNHPVLVRGVAWLEANQLPRADRPNMYFWYYGTQVMHHMGGQSWEKWNDVLRDLLISRQALSGHETGSWPPLGGHDSQGGRLYTTALAACTLEVYYRHLPLYRGVAAGAGDIRPRPGRRTPPAPDRR